MNSSRARFRATLFALVFCFAVSASSHAAAAQHPLSVTVDVNSVTIRAAAAPLLKYRYGDVPFKPYVSELFTPSGLNVLLDAPPDHLHHHGLMFAVAVDGVNFWEETPTAGRQYEDGVTQVEFAQHGGGPSAGFIVGPSWLDATGTKGELAEGRTIEVRRTDKLKATVVVWRSKLGVGKAKQSATLSGSHYFGLGMRFVRSMDGGEFFNAAGKEGAVFRGEERLVQADWCAYTATVEGKPVTVAMFGHPRNPRHPTTWFTMAKPFAYLSATLNLHNEPLSIGHEPLVLQYAVVVWDGKVDKGQIDQAYRWFTAEPATKVIVSPNQAVRPSEFSQ
jgi:hypothetical protein